MEQKSNDLFIKNDLLKINFDRNSKYFNFEIPKTLFYFLFFKIFFFIYLFILIIYELKGQKDEFKIIKSIFKNYLSKNGKSIISNKKENEEKEIYFDKYETNIFNKIKNKIINFPCISMWDNQREFLIFYFQESDRIFYFLHNKQINQYFLNIKF